MYVTIYSLSMERYKLMAYYDNQFLHVVVKVQAIYLVFLAQLQALYKYSRSFW